MMDVSTPSSTTEISHDTSAALPESLFLQETM